MSFYSNKLFFSIVSIALLSACGAANKSGQEAGGDKSGPRLICSKGVNQLENMEAGIVGGQLLGRDTWLAKGVVLVEQRFVDESGNAKFTRCTGSLIDANLVLTAAHCTDRVVRPEDLKVYFTNQPDCDSQNGKLAQTGRFVSAIKTHPSWGAKGVVKGDLSMVRLGSKAPSTWRPLKLTDSFLSLNHSHSVLLTGFGMTNVNLESLKYSADNSEGTLLRVTQAHPFSDGSQASDELLFIDQTQGTGVCAGDSGGPSLAQNAAQKFVITGVASYVANPTNEAALCGYASAYTSVIFHKDWIEKTFQELKDRNSVKKSLFN